jgi:succinoglycan biosynthesis transport protein ExoP
MKPVNESSSMRDRQTSLWRFETIGWSPRFGMDARKRPLSPDWSPKEMLGLLRRNAVIVAISVIICLAGGVGYILLVKPQFTATARIVIDANRPRFFAAAPASSPSQGVDESAIDSQIEIIKSEVIAAAVAKKLKLAQDAEFDTPKLGTAEAILAYVRWLAQLAGPTFAQPVHEMLDRMFGPSGKLQTSGARRLHIAIGNFERLLRVNRIGRSYIAEIDFTSVDPQKAALIANAIADAYIDNQLDARIYNTQRADAWIRRRLVELREQFQKASGALEKFKEAAPGSATAGGLSVQQRNSRLDELQSNADSYKSIYETFLNLSRYVQSVQEQSFPITDARIITRAAVPLTKSRPKTALTLVASLMLGVMVGAGLAFGRGLLDRRIRTKNQVEHIFGASCLGVLPDVQRRQPQTSDMASGFRDCGVAPLLDDCSSSSGAGEVLRAVRTAIDARMPRHSGVIGITSAGRGEGKTTLAVNLATVFHEAGRRVLLVDGDLRDRTISGAVSVSQEDGTATLIEQGLYAAVSGCAALADVVVSGSFGSCLPVETRQAGLRHPADFWSSSAAEKLLAAARKQYDYVIIDFPSLLAHVDAEAAASLPDGFVVVTKYANTKLDDLERALNGSGGVSGRLLGVVINRSPSS